MRTIRLLFVFAAWLAMVQAAVTIPAEEYRNRRTALRNALKGGATVLFGRTEKETEASRDGFSQEPNFHYLTGRSEPGAILVVSADHPQGEILFLPKRDPEVEKWTGRKLAPEDENVRALTGFETVLPAAMFETQLLKLLETTPRLYTLLDQPAAARLKALAPLRDVVDAKLAIARLRMTKSAREIALLERATLATVEAHRQAWRRTAAGAYEYQVAAAMSASYFEFGCERHAYPPIVGSGPNGAVLHYSRNERRMDNGELLLMDVGAECSGYAADVTRTIPVGGKFEARQRELYEIVLGAQKAAIAAVKPGMSMARTGPNSLHQIALEYINTHGKDREGKPLGKYFTHGLGHHIGLDVHDPFDQSVALAAGMVITIEPGIYIPEEGIGIRIEDMVLVTPGGARVLSESLPREPDDIERALRDKAPTR